MNNLSVTVFSGKVSKVYHDYFTIFEGICSDAPFRGLFIYDPSLSDLVPDDPNIGVYKHNPAGIFGISVQIGENTFQQDPNSPFTINVNPDPLLFISKMDFGRDISPACVLKDLRLRFKGLNNSLPPDALPSTLNLSDWKTARLEIVVYDGSNQSHLQGNLTSLQVYSTLGQPGKPIHVDD